ncbi:MAG: hypothetical protein QOD74_2267, partial [Variibacter sp.]|nr:hypothetical protein [Variibacter sp.]
MMTLRRFAVWAALCLLGLIVGLPFANRAQAQSAEAGQGVAVPFHAQAVMSDKAPELTPDQLSAREKFLANRPRPLQTPSAEGFQRMTPETDPSVPKSNPTAEGAQAAPQAPNTMTYFRLKAQNPLPTSSHSDILEPSVGTSGSVVFLTGNWTAMRSTDGGQNFSFVNPYTTFPSLDGGFCCDQTVIYDRSRDLFAWSLQYIKSNSTTTGRGSWRTAFATSAGVAAGSWCTYDWNPGSFGLGAGLWLDYPDVAITNTFVYYSVNAFTTNTDTWQRTIIWRIPLDQAKACQTVNFSYFTVNDRFTFSLAQGATNTMYFFSHNNTSSERLYNWPDGSGTIGWNDVPVTTWFDGTRTCTGPDGLNWCGRADGAHGRTSWVSGGVIGTMWSSAAGGGRPLPYIRVGRFNESTKALVNEPDVWNPSVAFIYNNVGINARGHLAGVLYYGNSSTYQTMATLIWDDFSTAPPGWELYNVVTSGKGTASRWGDYYSTRPHGAFPNTWVASGTNKLTDGTVQAIYLWFGRERDNPTTPACS